MATEAPEKTREQVAAMLKEGKPVKEIAEALGKTVATIYSHKRNIEGESGQAPRKRGRPRKSDAEKAATQAAKTVAASPPKTAAAPATNGNGTHVDLPELRADIQRMIDQKQAELAKLKEMLALTK